MVEKHFTLRLTVVSYLTFLSLVLSCFSCADHVTPEEPENPQQPELAKINTLNISGNIGAGFNHSVQFTDLGSVPIVEYGMVTFAGKPGDVKVPDIEALDPLTDRKYAFVEPGYTPPSLVAKTVTRAYDGPAGNPVRLFYRAYAMLLNNTIVYGEVKFIDFIKNQNNEIKPVIKTLDASKGDDSDFIAYSLQFESLGNISVAEYGMVIYQGKPNEQQTPEVPTDNALEKKYPYAEAANLDVKNIIQQYDGPTDGPIRLFYRAYAVLNNGEVVYGEVKFLDFEILIPAVIQTLGIASSASPVPNQINFLVQFQFVTPGNIAILEYGYILVSGLLGEMKNPDFPIQGLENKIPEEIYVDGPKLNPGLDIISTTFSVGKPLQSTRYFVRAYALLDNGEVVYGETKFIDHIVP